ncbi:rhomboid family intramembrane serine protease [Flavobacterium sp.]|uniref:rhomboid family intramembrane serine protease n=1 Tax=Flavobacterium sp. TaxID=239 RepID=UPI003A8E2D19
MMRITENVKHLLIINIIVYVGTLIIGQPVNDFLALHMPTDNHFKIWQVFTYMFMHGSPMHILFNMFALYSFGVVLEQMWGGKRFLFFYFSCGIGAALLHMGITYMELQKALEGAASLGLSKDTLHQILNINYIEGNYYKGELLEKQLIPILKDVGKLGLLNEDNFKSLFDAGIVSQSITVGASGAIYGILVAFAFLLPNAELMLIFLPIPIKAKYFVPVILLGDLVLGLKGESIFGGSDGIAHFAHLGGALVGFLMMWYWKRHQFNNNRWN